MVPESDLEKAARAVREQTARIRHHLEMTRRRLGARLPIDREITLLAEMEVALEEMQRHLLRLMPKKSGTDIT